MVDLYDDFGRIFGIRGTKSQNYRCLGSFWKDSNPYVSLIPPFAKYIENWMMRV